MLAEFARFYWPKLITALTFPAISVYVFQKNKRGGNIVWRAILLYFMSCQMVAMAGELMGMNIYYSFLQDRLSEDSLALGYAASNMTMDLILTLIFGVLYSKVVKKPIANGLTNYLQFVCVEKLAMIIGVGPISYLIAYIIAHTISLLLIRKDVKYNSQSTNHIKWPPVAASLYALTVLMDILYAGTYIVPEFTLGEYTVPNIWLDLVAILASSFAIRLLRINTMAAREYDKKIKYMEQFKASQEKIIQTLSEITEAKSGETGQHVKRVAEYSKIIARHMHMEEQDIEYLRVASMMHDVGKLMVPKEIIEKPGKLTPDEYEVMKTHTMYGNELLSHSEGTILNVGRIIATEHHERWDGTGYPRGLKGDEINIYALVVSVADVYDALVTKRSYKEAWPSLTAKQEIIDQSGKQFAPAVVDAFLEGYTEIEQVRSEYQD